MIDSSKQSNIKPNLPLGKQRNYNEIVEYLDKHWQVNANSKTLDRIKKLNVAFGSPAERLAAGLVAGTNGKSLTIHFTTKLLKEEKIKFGAFYSPHILTYNERFIINNEAISNKSFTEIGNDVINKAENLGLECYTQELLVMMAIVYFTQQEVEVALFEVKEGGTFDAANILDAKVAAITRATPDDVKTTEEELQKILSEMVGIVKTGTWVVSGDQNKQHLQLMQNQIKPRGGNWAMPIRKLAALPYPFEQLHGRCAALAERIAQMFVEKFYNKNALVLSESILAKQNGKRGRPTLDDKKRQLENPKKTVDQVWKETVSELPLNKGKFQLLDKEKPSILVDTACNVDAFKNLLLGVRLLHYQRPLKGLTIIVAAPQDAMHNEEFLKSTRYFFKKTSGQIFICPIEEVVPGIKEETSWDIEKVANDLKVMKVKAKACKSFEEAFDLAKKSVDEKYGLVVITGSTSIVNKYWQQKGIKKF